MQTVEPSNIPSENESMVLEEEIDENYEPTQEEILEYADYLGINPSEDQDLLYLAKEGLKAPLPEDWKPCQNREGKIYYFNFKTKQSQWEHPCDQYYKKLYQELKRKKEEKTQKQSNFKGKTLMNSPNKEPLQKRDSLPSLRNTSKNQNTLQAIEESFAIDDNQQSFSLNPKGSSNENVENSFSSEKKFGEQPILNEFENFQTLGKQDSEKLLNNNIEVEENISKYEKQKQADIEQLQKKQQEEMEKFERELKQNLEKDMKSLKNELIHKFQKESNSSFIQEKENLKHNLKILYQRKFEEKTKDVKKDFEKEYKKVEIQEMQNVSQDLRREEDDLVEEYEMKLNSLGEEHKKLKSIKEKLKSQEESRKKDLEDELNQEKKRIENDYARIFREEQAKERMSHSKTIQDYKDQLNKKLNHERTSFLNAMKQKESLALKIRTELREEYERKLKLEQEKLENNYLKVFKDYEANETRRKDKEILKLQEIERAHERDTQQLLFQNEIDTISSNFKNRYQNYLQILREKLNNEKERIDKEITAKVEEYKNSVDMIETSLNTNESIIEQLEKISLIEQSSKLKLQEIDEKLMILNNEIQTYEQRLTYLRKEQRNAESISNKIIQDLLQKIKDAEKEIFHNSVQEKINIVKPLERPKSVPHLRDQFSKSFIDLNALKDDVKEIRTFFTRREMERSARLSHREIAKTYKSPRKPYLNYSLASSKENHELFEGAQPYVYRNWVEILNKEVLKLQAFKKELKETKLSLKKVQESIINQRTNIKDYKDFAVQESENGIEYSLKKIKADLNQQIQKVNDQVEKLKENQRLLKEKETKLKEFKISVEQFENNEITQDELEKVYEEYQNNYILKKSPLKSVRTISPFERQTKTLNLSFRESYYDKEYSVLDPKLTEQDLRMQTARTIGERQTLKPYNYNKEYRRPKVQSFGRRKSFHTYEEEDKKDLSYGNLINILDMKVKSDSTISQTFLVQREIKRTSNERSKITNVFSEHSKWLKDMKDQLNKHLYERPGKNILSFK